MNKFSICLLVSGDLGLEILENLYENIDVRLHSVFTDKKSEKIIDFCNKMRIPVFIGNPRNGKAQFFIKETEKPDILLSVNYLFLIERDLIEYPKNYAVNIHGSLLPKYRGRTPHVWAIINNEKQTGITAHIITEECDKGAIICQKIIPISINDTGGSILKIYKETYPVIINELIYKIQNNEINMIAQDEKKATYFPKRTPEDGEIDWSWQRERIYNWVRAMAPPEYPGAFFYLNKEKIIIEKAEFSECGFPLGTKDGEILYYNDKSYIIKTPNGCIKLYKFDFTGQN